MAEDLKALIMDMRALVAAGRLGCKLDEAAGNHGKTDRETTLSLIEIIDRLTNAYDLSARALEEMTASASRISIEAITCATRATDAEHRAEAAEARAASAWSEGREAALREVTCGLFDFDMDGMDEFDLGMVKDAITEVRQQIIEHIKALTPPAALPGGERASVPDGWKLVPIKATPEMILAAYNRDRDGTTNLYYKTWEAMLAASPAGRERGEGAERWLRR